LVIDRRVLVAAVLVTTTSSTVHAYEVETPLSDPCHERATLTAAIEAGVDQAAFENIALPRDDTWAELQPLWRIHVPGPLEPEQAFVLHSMYVGVRAPDTGGESVTNPRNARIWHRSEGANPHCTRKPHDDGVVDDRVVERCREVVRAQLDAMAETLGRPASEQIHKVPFTIDFYGEIDVDVWLPAYHLGRALHSVQDSFSHSIRSDNLQRIWHVLNFDDALTRDYVEERDGLRHSGAMDRCDGTTDPIYDTAIEASADVVAACLADGTSLQHPGTGVVTTLLERWMRYEPGCNHGSGYCDSPWLELARTEPTAPVLGGCAVTPERDTVLGLACVLLVVLRRRRKLTAA
jgi:hypothetical protein